MSETETQCKEFHGGRDSGSEWFSPEYDMGLNVFKRTRICGKKERTASG